MMRRKRIVLNDPEGSQAIIHTQFFIPEGLKRFDNWVLWRTEEHSGRLTKVPYSACYNGKASSTNPSTWTDFDSARITYREHINHYKGIGFVISLDTGVIFIDIDDCIKEDGTLDNRAIDILNTLGITFCEVSQSGSGLHLFAIGTIPKSFKNPHNGIEMYNCARYCAITGNALFPVELCSDQTTIEAIYEKYKTPDRIKKADSGTNVRTHVSSYSDLEIIRKCMKSSRSGELFSRLYRGEYEMYARKGESGHHIADFVLCSILAFWTNRNKDQIDRIFRTSGLVRDKWTDREDYRENTLDLACDSLRLSVNEYIQEKIEEEYRLYEDCFLQDW